MHRAIVCLLCSSFALAQVRQRPPLDILIHAYSEARNNGRFEEAAGKREEARRLLSRMPVDEPQFGRWAQNVSQLYEQSAMSAQARTVLEEALSRAEPLGQSHPTRVLLLNAIAESWLQDRNLLKAVLFREKAIADMESGLPPRSDTYAYYRLADLYRQLGGRDAHAALLAKMRTLAGQNESLLASLYESEGQLEEAAAVYKKQAERAVANSQGQPWQLAGPFQSLANLYQREQRYSDAVAVTQQAIDILQTSRDPGSRNQALILRQNVAGILQQAGQPEAADTIYRQLIAETGDGRNPYQFQILSTYANFLAGSKRGAEAEKLLNEYLATRSGVEPHESVNALIALANVANISGDQKRAEEYRRSATEKQQAMANSQSSRASTFTQSLFAKDLERAQSALNAGNVDEGFSLALQALDASSRGAGREMVGWQMTSIAMSLAYRKLPERAEQLYQSLMALTRAWSGEDLQPMLSVLQSYPRFLMHESRWGEVASAIERYREALTAARGPATGHMEDVYYLTLEFERKRQSPASALAVAEDLLKLEESLSGTTSEPYFRAVEMLAEVSESNGDSARAIQLRRQAVAIVDAAFSPNDSRRLHTRMNVARSLARQRQFDEAELVMKEAMVTAQRMRPPQHDSIASTLEQIRRIKVALPTR